MYLQILPVGALLLATADLPIYIVGQSLDLAVNLFNPTRCNRPSQIPRAFQSTGLLQMVARQLALASEQVATLTSRSTHLRTFFALKPSAEMIRQLTACIDGLQGRGWSQKVRWMAVSNIHMTLRFLGNTDAAIISDLLQGINSGFNLKPISYEIDNILVFPSASRPRVIAAMVAENEQLSELVEILQRSLQCYGFAAESKSFRGHFTLGRCKRDFPKKITIDCPFDPIRSLSTEVVLYQSDTRPTAAIYTSLGTIRLQSKTV